MSCIYTFKDYLKEKYNKRLWRLPLSTGYPCPNRINGKAGCTFCNGLSFLPRYLKDNDRLQNQIERGMKFFGNRYKVDEFYGYFQFNTGTYGDLNDLLNKYKFVLSKKFIKGLIISTRPDFIKDDILNELNALNKDYNKDIWFELGLQSVYDATLKRINRNHSYNDFKDAVLSIKKNGDFKITVHMIIGLPGESPDMIKEGIKKLFKENNLDGIKLRLLEILPDTPMYDEYKMKRYDFYEFNAASYSILLCDLLELIPEDVVVMRMVNFKSLQILSKDLGTQISKREILIAVEDEFKKRGTRQGAHYK